MSGQPNRAGRVKGRVLIAKTSLDGHWIGVTVVARALRDAGFDVIYLGMATANSIVAAAEQEDVDLVGLNIGGRIEVVERILDALGTAAPTVPVIAGGTIAPSVGRRLEARGVVIFPPGSSTRDIVATAARLCQKPVAKTLDCS